MTKSPNRTTRHCSRSPLRLLWMTLALATWAGQSVAADAKGGIPGILAPGVTPELVRDDFKLTEGPLGAKDGSLFFSERGGTGRTYHLALDGTLTIAREPTQVANGLAYAPNGDIIEVEEKGERVVRWLPSGQTVTLTDSYQGHPFMAPNDLIVDKRGGVYFTDPGPRPLVAGRPTYVFYLPPGANEPLLVDGKVPRPNGLTLSLDGKRLFVDDTLGPMVFAYDIKPDGSVVNKRPWLRLRVKDGDESGADGMAIDRNGNLYVATALGVQVFDRGRRYLGAITLPRSSPYNPRFHAYNLAFAGRDKRTLYITALRYLYRVETLVPGPKRLGK